MHNLFYLLPNRLKSVAVSAIAGNKSRMKYGSHFKRHLDYLFNRDATEQDSDARESLHSFLERLSRECRAYSVPSSRDVHAMNIINKDWVQRNKQALTLDPIYTTVKSSGTSGSPLTVPYTQSAYQKEYAFWWYHRAVGNVKQGMRVATFAGHQVVNVDQQDPPFWVDNFFENQVFFSSYHLSSNNIDSYIEKLNHFSPELIHGYPSSLYLIARRIVETARKLDFQPQMIATASETTLDFQRKIIEIAFGCKLRVWYGNTEFAGHITECAHNRLHTQPYHSYIRIVNKDGDDVKLGGSGNIIASNWTNTALCLVNYDTHDVATLSKDQSSCACGMGGVLLDEIIGRIEDYIITKDGRLVGRLDHLFKEAKYVRNAQIEQHDKGKIIIKIERQSGYNITIENYIRAEAVRRLGKSTDISFYYVNEIAKNINGKFKFIIQHLKTGSLKQALKDET